MSFPPRTMVPRPYDVSRRRAATEATRARILEAARLLLSGTGDLTDFSMEAIARSAGVARMTVYNQFHSRAELLDALSDHLAARGGMHRMREVFVEPDLERAVERLVETFVTFWAADRVAMRRLRALGVIAPKRYGRPRGRDDWRREAVTHLLAKFDPSLRPTPRSSRRGAVDLLAALTSFEVFDALAAEGRSPDDVAELLGRAALAVLRAGLG